MPPRHIQVWISCIGSLTFSIALCHSEIPALFVFILFLPSLCRVRQSYIRCHFDLLLLRRLCHTDPQSQFQKAAPTSAASDYIWRSTISRLRFEALSGQLAPPRQRLSFNSLGLFVEDPCLLHFISTNPILLKNQIRPLETFAEHLIRGGI
jgi:hypothetical protein